MDTVQNPNNSEYKPSSEAFSIYFRRFRGGGGGKEKKGAFTVLGYLYRRVGKTGRFHLQGSSSGTNLKPPYVTEEWKPQIPSGRSLKSRERNAFPFKYLPLYLKQCSCTLDSISVYEPMLPLALSYEWFEVIGITQMKAESNAHALRVT
jgi:hypothetical protein